MMKSGYLALAVGPADVSHRNLEKLQIEFRRTKDEIEVTERVEIAKVTVSRFQAQIVGPLEHLCTAQRVRTALVQEPGEQIGKCLVCDQIQKPHGFVFQGIYEARAVDEFSLSFVDCCPEFRQELRRHGQIRVEDHQYIGTGGIESGKHRVSLAVSGL